MSVVTFVKRITGLPTGQALNSGTTTGLHWSTTKTSQRRVSAVHSLRQVAVDVGGVFGEAVDEPPHRVGVEEGHGGPEDGAQHGVVQAARRLLGAVDQPELVAERQEQLFNTQCTQENGMASVQYGTVQCSTVQCSSVQYSSAQYTSVQ